MARQSYDPKHLPMCIESRRPAPARRPWSHLAVLLVVLAVTAFALRGASTSPVHRSAPGIGGLEAAVQTMTGALEGLPRHALIRTGGEVKTLARQIEGALLKIKRLPAPPVDPALAHDIAFLQDLLQATTAELEGLPHDGALQAEPIARIGRLAATAGERVVQLDAAVDAWAEHGRGSIVTVEERPEALLVRSVDRLVSDSVRAGGTMLFLIGLLLLGSRFLTVGEGALGLRHPFQQAPLRSAAGAAALALFMAGSFVLGTRPEILLDLSADTRIHPREDACLSLSVQRGQLRAAQDLSNTRLIEAVERRMEGAAATCLGLETAVAAAEAVEHFAGPPAAVDEGAAAPHATVAASGRSGAGTDGDLSRLVRPGRAHAAELPDAALPPSAIEDTSPAATAPAGEVADRADRAPTASEPPPPPPEPALMPLPPDPAPRALVTTTVVNYRAGPSRSADRLGTLARGTTVRLVSEVDVWSIVRLEDGRRVYVASEFLQRVE